MPKKKQRSEKSEAYQLMEWVKWHEGQYPDLKYFYHIPNERRSIGMRVMLSKMGVKGGVPDYHLPAARQGLHGLWIELKKEKGPRGGGGGTVSEAQKDWIAFLEGGNHRVVVAHGWEEAVEAIENYLS